MYRANFSAVDVYNKLTFGPRSLQKPFYHRDWRIRFWLACLAMCETNAYMVNSYYRERSG
jgi:hypothetical protein